MQRREALRNFALIVGGGLLSGTTISMLNSCNTTGKQSDKQLFSDGQQDIVTELADVIIPTTSCLGAKAAGVGPFITMMMNDCYPEDVQQNFVKGLDDFSKSVKDKFGKDFILLSAEDKIKAVSQLRDQTLAAQKADDKKSNKKPAGFFTLMRDLTIMGYFTSEIGAKQATAYLDVPGHYEGCATLKPGQKAWAAN